MQGSVIRALVELITNSDDSYNRLEGVGECKKGIIEILYNKEAQRGFFGVRDYAAGMSIEEVRDGLTKYGAATSGMQRGQTVRGYFGQGAKDALAGMSNGRICTFKDGKFVEYSIFIKNGKIRGTIDGPVPATQKHRSLHKVDGNGSIAYFEVDREIAGRIPRFETLRKDLSNSYLLRKIMTNPRRKVVAVDEKGGVIRQLKYQMPRGEEVLSEDFTINYSKFHEFHIHNSIWRSDHELTQMGDDREGGLLLVDEDDAVLGISLFRYDSEPLAARFFGEVKIGEFRRLLKAEEPVLREERDGLVNRHPFCQILIPEIEKRIEKKVKEERLRRQKQSQSKIDREEARRYKKAFSILNKIAEIEVQSVTNLGKDPSTQLERPQNGFCLYPESAQITVGKRYAFELRLDTNVVRHGSIVRLSSTNTKIRVLTPDMKVSAQDGSGILSKYVTVEGSEPNVDGILRAVSANSLSEAKIFVVPEKGTLLYEEGLEFEPGSLTLHPNRTRKAYLLVYVKIIQGGSQVTISSDNGSIHVSKHQIIVSEADAKRHVAKYELELWGEGVGQAGVITAECGSFIALLEVHVRSKREAPEKNRKGMFNEPEFVYDSEPTQRTSYSSETGTVNVYVNFPSVKHYLGGDCRYRKTLPAQVLVADLVAERCFYEMAKCKVGTRVGVTLGPQAVPDRIQRDARELSCKYGKLVHEALVDEALVKKTRNGFDE
jgi:hypothetical protein